MRYVSTMAERNLGRHYLKEWRKKRGLSLRKLADRMEIEPGVPLMSHANIGRIENFEQPYSQELLEAAAEALECSVSDLLSVNPLKDGKVIDIMDMLRGKSDADMEAAKQAIELVLSIRSRNAS